VDSPRVSVCGDSTGLLLQLLQPEQDPPQPTRPIAERMTRAEKALEAPSARAHPMLRPRLVAEKSPYRQWVKMRTRWQHTLQAIALRIAWQA